ncbi:alpha/beta hydrolase [Piscinibacter sakaiensis]|uniref:alpha/beta hydrolase n=1 Tax=Piscinibacter sakaiensis TaxID=1547922 RepID=UPI003AAED9DD
MASQPEHHWLDLADSRVHYVTMGDGAPLVLLHGWPQTWYAWRKLMPALAQRHRVIAPDLRGLGDSSRPADGFDKRSVARDVADLLQRGLGIDRAAVVGHDWGGPVAFALAAFHPKLVSRLVMLDAAVPGDGSGTFSQSGRRWHHAFHQTPELPEQLISGREAIYYGWFYEHYGHVRGAIDADASAEFLRTYRDPQTLRTGLAYYRALDADVAANAQWLKDNRLQMPVLAIGGAEAYGRGGETCRRCSVLPPMFAAA